MENVHIWSLVLLQNTQMEINRPTRFTRFALRWSKIVSSLAIRIIIIIAWMWQMSELRFVHTSRAAENQRCASPLMPYTRTHITCRYRWSSKDIRQYLCRYELHTLTTAESGWIRIRFIPPLTVNILEMHPKSKQKHFECARSTSRTIHRKLGSECGKKGKRKSKIHHMKHCVTLVTSVHTLAQLYA